MAKVDLDLVKMILKRNDLEVKKIAEIMEEINFELANTVEEEKPPMVKKQFVILISDPQKQLEGKDFVGWVLQIPEEDSPYSATDKIFQAVYDFNVSPKGRRSQIKRVAEACENVSARFFKEHKVWVKNKEPVLVITTDNRIPKDAPASLEEDDAA